MDNGISQMYEVDHEPIEVSKRQKVEDGVPVAVAGVEVPAKDDVSSLPVASEDKQAANNMNIVPQAVPEQVPINQHVQIVPQVVPEQVPTNEHVQEGYLANLEADSISGGSINSSSVPVALANEDYDHELRDFEAGNIGASDYFADDEAGSSGDESSDASSVPGELAPQLQDVALLGNDDPAFAPDEPDEDGYMADDEASDAGSNGSDSSAAESGLTQVSTGSDDSV